MDLRDATLMFAIESAAHPELAAMAQSAYDDMSNGHDVGHQRLSQVIGKASEKGVLRTMHRKYSATAYDAILMPILSEIDRRKPVPPRRPPTGPDPLTDPYWSRR
jgi:hypothetical protein